MVSLCISDGSLCETFLPQRLRGNGREGKAAKGIFTAEKKLLSRDVCGRMPVDFRRYHAAADSVSSHRQSGKDAWNVHGIQPPAAFSGGGGVVRCLLHLSDSGESSRCHSKSSSLHVGSVPAA